MLITVECPHSVRLQGNRNNVPRNSWGINLFVSLLDHNGTNGVTAFEVLLDEINVESAIAEYNSRKCCDSKVAATFKGKIEGLQYAKYRLQALNSSAKLNGYESDNVKAIHAEAAYLAKRESDKRQASAYPSTEFLIKNSFGRDFRVVEHYTYRQKWVCGDVMKFPRILMKEFEQRLLDEVGITGGGNHHVFKVEYVGSTGDKVIYIGFTDDVMNIGTECRDGY